MRKSLLFLRSLLTLLVVEAAVLAALAVVLLVELVAGRSGSVGVSLFLVLFLLGVGWALVAAARALRAGRRAARGLVMTWQLFQVLAGMWLIGSGAAWAVVAGIAALVLAVGVVTLLFSRPVVEVTTEG